MNMNHDRSTEFEDSLRLLSFDDSPRPEHCDALREQVVAAFDRAAQNCTKPSVVRQTWSRGKTLMMGPISRFALAACLLVALAWFLLPGSGTANAFTKLVDAILSATSARFHADMTTEG